MATSSQGSMGVLMRCARGEEWPLSSFSMVPLHLGIDLNDLTAETVRITCPAGHSFTLQKAIQKGIIPEEDAARLLINTTTVLLEARWEYDEREAEGWRARPSDFLENQEVIAKGWRCVKCGEKAQWALNKKDSKTALCNVCRAAWHNFQREAFRIFSCTTSGRPYDIFFRLMWKKFLNGEEDKITKVETEELVVQFRRQARRESQERSRKKKKPHP